MALDLPDQHPDRCRRTHAPEVRHPAAAGARTGALTFARFDLPGAGLVTGGLVGIVAGVSQATTWGWASAGTLSLLGAGVVFLVAFIGVEARGSQPLIPLRLFTVRTVAAGNAVMLLIGAALLGLFYFLSLFEQNILGYDATKAGLSQLPLAIVLAASAGAAAPLMARFGTRVILASGLLLLAGGLVGFGFSRSDGTFTVDVLGPSLLVGLGLGLAFVPVTTAAVAGVDERDGGVAGGLVNVSQQIGGGIGLAALATLAVSQTRAAHGSMVHALTTGYHSAFFAAAGIALAGVAVTIAALRRHDDGDAPAA